MKAELQQLKKEIIAGQTINHSSVTTGNASLAQNIPNPFSNTTAINYALPLKHNSARIVVTDKNGKRLKELDISGNGKGTVHLNVATLPAGTYNYALIIDGRSITSRQMILAK